MAKNDLTAELSHTLTLYHQDLNTKIDKAGNKAIKELERITKDTAPFNAKAHHVHFVDCIATKKVTDRVNTSTFLWFVKAPCYRLTHLLVRGHETRDGGRTKANPFLKNALDQVLPDYEQAVKEAVKTK